MTATSVVNKGVPCTAAETAVDATADLRGRKCPMTFVYTKLELERLERGQILKVILDYAPSFTNVPRSVELQDLGEVICNPAEQGGEKTLWIRKK
ncbi:MAG: sulfurtransferase TusA family protein [Deltaproteobacteria bacterium]|nr:sulfurtransferase TusA family protein [Deltaproteobacteria bacterium]